MKKQIIITLSLVFALFSFSITKVSAKIITNNDNVSIPKTEVVNDDLLITSNNSIIDGTINGDVFIAGQTVTINGVVNGNLHVGARVFNLNGRVTGNVYVAGENINIAKSTIGGSILTAGRDININQNTVIGGSIFAGSSNLTIDAQVKRNSYFAAANMNIEGNTKINKDLYYVSGDKQTINISDKAIISGNTYKTNYQSSTKPQIQKPSQGQMATFKFGFSLVSLIGALIVGLIYIKLFNSHSVKSVDSVSKSFWKSFGIGFLTIISIVPAIIFGLITIVGGQLVWMTLLFFLMSLYLAKIIVGISLGSWLLTKLNFTKQSNQYLSLAVGLVIIYLLKLIPVGNILISFIITWVGLGAIVSGIFSKSK